MGCFEGVGNENKTQMVPLLYKLCICYLFFFLFACAYIVMYVIFKWCSIPRTRFVDFLWNENHQQWIYLLLKESTNKHIDNNVIFACFRPIHSQLVYLATALSINRFSRQYILVKDILKQQNLSKCRDIYIYIYIYIYFIDKTIYFYFSTFLFMID